MRPLLKLFPALCAGALLAFALNGDALAQSRRGGFFDQLFGGGIGGVGGGGRSSQQPFDGERAPQADYSRAPAPKKQDAVPMSTVMVMGDSMADWLAYGLEDAFADTPEIGVVRKHKTISGLIRYDSRASDQDWARVARDLLAKEKADIVVMMLGLNDRISIREAQPPRKNARDQKGKDAKNQNQPQDQNKDQNKDQAANKEQKAEDRNDNEELDLNIVAPEPARGAGGSDEFRSDRWAELYGKKIDETIAALKSRGVPVIWVGLPAVRGARSTSDAQYLNEIYRARAQKAGIVYVDVWDGFVDESGRFSLQGPDVDGQTRRLRAYDGVHFTSYGSRKLAHYVDREIRRLMTGRNAPIAIPSGPSGPEAAPAAPAGPAARPLAGPVMPLASAPQGPDELLGATRAPGIADPAAARVLVKGETVAAPAGRADDFSWPRGDASNPSAAIPVDVTPAAAAAAPDKGGRNTRRQSATPAQTSAAQGNRRNSDFIPPPPQQNRQGPPAPVARSNGGGLFGLFR